MGSPVCWPAFEDGGRASGDDLVPASHGDLHGGTLGHISGERHRSRVEIRAHGRAQVELGTVEHAQRELRRGFGHPSEVLRVELHRWRAVDLVHDVALGPRDGALDASRRPAAGDTDADLEVAVEQQQGQRVRGDLVSVELVGALEGPLVTRRAAHQRRALGQRLGQVFDQRDGARGEALGEHDAEDRRLAVLRHRHCHCGIGCCLGVCPQLTPDARPGAHVGAREHHQRDGVLLEGHAAAQLTVRGTADHGHARQSRRELGQQSLVLEVHGREHHDRDGRLVSDACQRLVQRLVRCLDGLCVVAVAYADSHGSPVGPPGVRRLASKLPRATGGSVDRP